MEAGLGPRRVSTVLPALNYRTATNLNPDGLQRRLGPSVCGNLWFLDDRSQKLDSLALPITCEQSYPPGELFGQ